MDRHPPSVYYYSSIYFSPTTVWDLNERRCKFNTAKILDNTWVIECVIEDLVEYQWYWTDQIAYIAVGPTFSEYTRFFDYDEFLAPTIVITSKFLCLMRRDSMARNNEELLLRYFPKHRADILLFNGHTSISPEFFVWYDLSLTPEESKGILFSIFVMCVFWYIR